MPLLEARQRVKPVEYQWAWDANKAAIRSRWDHEDGITWTGDLKDWKAVTEQDRRAISGILKGFTLIEDVVGCYWGEVAYAFHIPEIAAMARTFSAQEVVHLLAYQALEDNLGIDSYDAFIQDEVAQKKLADLMDFKFGNMSQCLAVFSGAVEGVSLFSSFAVLQSYCLDGRFNAMRQILSWSMADENLHSKNGIKLYKTLLSEYPDKVPSSDMIEKGFRLVVTNELNFIDQIFADGDLPHISKDETVAYIIDRANDRFHQLTGKYLYTDVSKPLAQKVASWMEPLSGNGATTNDFFSASRNGTSYSTTISQNFEDLDVEAIWNKL